MTAPAGGPEPAGSLPGTSSDTSAARHTSAPVVILIGPPGSGKSTVGPLLAGRLHVSFLDTDDEVASIARKPVSDIFVEDGEPAFRALERAVVERALHYHGVVALGSGAVADERTRQLLAGHRVVYLETGFAEVAKRSGLSRPRIPVPGNPRGMLRAMLEQRRPLYEGLAVLTVDTDGLSPDEIASHIAAGQQDASREHGR